MSAETCFGGKNRRGLSFTIRYHPGRRLDRWEVSFILKRLAIAPEEFLFWCYGNKTVKKENLLVKKYQIIYADPPWSYRDKARAGKRGAEYKYPCMSVEQIKALPVNALAAADCALFLWVTFPMLSEGLEVIQAWGFIYKTVAFTWVKTTRNGKLFWGMGNLPFSNAEVCLLGVKGHPTRISTAVHSVIMATVREHSQKPDETRGRIVQLMGDLPRIELFARKKVPGWDAIGNDIDGRDIKCLLAEAIRREQQA